MSIFSTVIGGVVKGVGAVFKGVKSNKDLRSAFAGYQNTGVAGYQVQTPRKGFLGMFTGKKIIAKQQAEVIQSQQQIDQVKAMKLANTSATLKTFAPYAIGLLGLIGIVWFVNKPKSRGRK
jgi:hypothetical protein